MIIEIDFTSDIPIYIQLRNEIVKLIVSDVIKPNESLPSVRRLASDLNINHMTVAKTYRLLKEEGFVEIDRRIGAKVIGKNDIQNILLEEFYTDMDNLLSKAEQLNIDRNELIKMIQERKG